MRILINILTMAVILISINSYAYDDEIAHRRMTREAVISSEFNDYLIKNLGLLDGINTIIEGDKVFEWLREGSFLEDEPPCRASNHFHNPLKPWADSGVSDQPWYINAWCFLDNEYPPANIKSNVHWATGYTAPSQPEQQTTNGIGIVREQIITRAYKGRSSYSRIIQSPNPKASIPAFRRFAGLSLLICCRRGRDVKVLRYPDRAHP